MQTPQQLPRVLGFWAATAIVIGTVIGSGVFKKANSVAGFVPEFSLAMFAWVLVGILTLFGALALAEVAVIIPKSGGNYAILRDSYGPWAGYLFGWVEFWIIRSASIAALATIFTESLHDVLRQLHPDGPDIQILNRYGQAAVTASVILGLAYLNARGTRLGAGVQIVVTLVKVLSLVGLALLPLIAIATFGEASPRPSVQNLQPFWPETFDFAKLAAFGGAMVGVFWAYNGWMNIAPIAEEVTDPQKNIPRSLLTGVFVLITLYVSVNLAYYLSIPSNEIAAIKGRSVAGEFTLRMLGSIGLVLASGAIMVSVFGSLNGNLLVGPRLLYAMGNDGLAPRFLGKLHPRYQTPARAEAVLAGWTILMVTAVAMLPESKDPFDVITDFAMFGSLSLETFAVASIFVLRKTHPVATVKLPYRCPWYPTIPIVYCVCLAAVLANMFFKQRTESLIGLGFITLGAIVYFVFYRKRGR
jgi:basic amino acid/polyamine antiporter, APA family